MYHCDLSDADITAALWRLFEGTTGSSGTSGPQGIYENSITGYPSTADTELTNFNADNYTALTPISTTSMKTFATESDYSHPVSKQQFDRRH